MQNQTKSLLSGYMKASQMKSGLVFVYRKKCIIFIIIIF